MLLRCYILTTPYKETCYVLVYSEFIICCTCLSLYSMTLCAGQVMTLKWKRYILMSLIHRLELEGGTILVGEFQGFKGRPRDTQTLSFANRSAVSQMVMTHRQGWINNIFGEYNHLDGVRDPFRNFPSLRILGRVHLLVRHR